MTHQWSFRYAIPSVPDGKPITAEKVEETLLHQLQTHQRPEEDVLWELARLYSVTGRQDLAFVQMERLVENTKTAEEKAACYLAMGQLMEQVRDYRMAIRFYSEALGLEPINGPTWYFIHNNLGYCLNNFGRYVEAEPYCRRAIEIDPLRHNAYKNLGISLEGQRRYGPAAMCYITAVQTNASDPRAPRHLEALLDKQPETRNQIPDFERHLMGCRAAVEQTAQVRNLAVKQFDTKAVAAKSQRGLLAKVRRFAQRLGGMRFGLGISQRNRRNGP